MPIMIDYCFQLYMFKKTNLNCFIQWRRQTKYIRAKLLYPPIKPLKNSQSMQCSLVIVHSAKFIGIAKHIKLLLVAVIWVLCCHCYLYFFLIVLACEIAEKAVDLSFIPSHVGIALYQEKQVCKSSIPDLCVKRKRQIGSDHRNLYGV